MGLKLQTSEVDDADVALEEPPLARTSFWQELVYELDREGQLTEAVAELLGGKTKGEALDVLEEIGVADDYATALLKAAQDGDDPAVWGRFIRETAYQGAGGFNTAGEARSLDDLDERTLRVFAADAVDEPTVAVSLPDDWRDRETVQRRRWLGWLATLAEGLDIRLVLSRVELLALLDAHEDDLPASVVNDARQTGHTEADPIATAAESVRGDPAVRVLAALRGSTQERLTIDDLQRHAFTDDVSRSANSKRVTRLEELSLVDRRPIDGERHIVLLPRGERVLELLDDPTPSAVGGSKGVSPDGGQVSDAGTSAESLSGAGVTNPPKRSTGPCTPMRARGTPPGPGSAPEPDPAAEAAALDAEETPDRNRDGWAPLWWHHAVDAVSADAGAVLVDESTAGEELPDRPVSFDHDRSTAVVGIRPDSTIARTAARFAAALADDRILNSVLTEERVGDDLEKLAIDNAVVRRLAAQIGWHGEEDQDRRTFRDRLRAAGAELLEDAAAVSTGDGFDPELATDVTRRAHGLAGTIVRLLDLAGVDVSVELRDDWRAWSEEGFDALSRFLATATAISTVHGAYPMFRTMFEDREDRRDAMLGAPTVDPDNPEGETLISWVLRGPGADNDGLRRRLEDMDSLLESVDEDRANYAEFYSDLEVRSTGREDVAAVAARVLSFKDIDTTRQAVSLLHGLSSGPFAAAKAVYGLGTETYRPDRDLAVDEVRTALANLDPSRLVPEIDANSNSRAAGEILKALLTADEPLSLAALAEAADVSKQAARNRRDELEALGLLETEDLGAGRATLHSLAIGAERGDTALPEAVDDDHYGVADAALEVIRRLTGHNPVLDDNDTWTQVVLEGNGTIFDLLPPGMNPGILVVARQLVGDQDDSRAGRRTPTSTARIGKVPNIGQTPLLKADSTAATPGD